MRRRDMLVNEIKEYKVYLQGREEPLILRLDFKALIKMHKIYKNAFLLIHDFTANHNIETLPKLMACMATEEITAEELEEKLFVNYNAIDEMARIINELIIDEVIEGSEFEVKTESKKTQVKAEAQKKK